LQLCAAVLQMSGSQPPVGRGAPCLRCRGLCTGFEPHSWRKICKSCKCSQEEHGLSSELDDDRKIGRLLSGSRHASLTARLKGGDGARVYKRNRMIVTNPNISGKDPTFDTITYESHPCCPAALCSPCLLQSPSLDVRTTPPGLLGLSGLRKQRSRSGAGGQLGGCASGLLLSCSQRASLCCWRTPCLESGLRGPIPGVPHSPSDEEQQPTPIPAALRSCLSPGAGRCESCQQPVPGDCPVVYAERAGSSRLWHPACFVCCRCAEPLVDLIYFWKSGAAWCGRHYCESLRPRCAGCDEIIFSEDYQQVEGLAWHHKHFACLECETLLTGKPFTLANASLLCSTCSQSRV
ncbi:LMCD1 protein, partial [Passerina amoena]|nr:LMCD1 protein [Passerina amoena]